MLFPSGSGAVLACNQRPDRHPEARRSSPDQPSLHEKNAEHGNRMGVERDPYTQGKHNNHGMAKLILHFKRHQLVP